jgi:hypothetical protein
VRGVCFGPKEPRSTLGKFEEFLTTSEQTCALSPALHSFHGFSRLNIYGRVAKPHPLLGQLEMGIFKLLCMSWMSADSRRMSREQSLERTRS